MADVTVLRSVDPSANRFRFYVLQLRVVPSGVELVRRWGRVGTPGRTRIERFPALAHAEDARARLVQQKTGRGYVAIDGPS